MTGVQTCALPIFKLITEATKKVKNIDQVIVGMGPGPFTGLRAGIAFAQSFAFARGLPILASARWMRLRRQLTIKNLLSQPMLDVRNFIGLISNLVSGFLVPM